MPTSCNVGALVLGALTGPRSLVDHAKLLAAYADGRLADAGETREAYLSHFVYDSSMPAHVRTNRGSVAGFAGPCGARWLIFDIDLAELHAALTEARKLVTFLHQRYADLEPAAFFSGSKGFHIMLQLAHEPPPSVGFQHVAKAFALGVARAASVAIDEGIYDVNRVVRLPNTRHPKTGRFKRRLSLDELFNLDAARLLKLAEYPFGDDLPLAKCGSAQLAADWAEAEARSRERAAVRAQLRRQAALTPDIRAPRWLLEFLRFGVAPGQRHVTLFRAAAYLTEQGAPPSLVAALLTEPGCDVGLPPADVDRQIRCGIAHAVQQRQALPDGEGGLA